MESAKKAFEKYYGVSAESSILKNDANVSMPNPKNREAVREAIAQNYAIAAMDREVNDLEAYNGVNNNPDAYSPESLDFFCTFALKLSGPTFPAVTS